LVFTPDRAMARSSASSSMSTCVTLMSSPGSVGHV
jgi:hypothetical protein